MIIIIIDYCYLIIIIVIIVIIIIIIIIAITINRWCLHIFVCLVRNLRSARSHRYMHFKRVTRLNVDKRGVSKVSEPRYSHLSVIRGRKAMNS